MTSDIQVEYKFAIVPEWIIDLDISSTAFRLYAVLARYADNHTHRAFPSRETLSQRLRCSIKTVERAVRELQATGAIRCESRGRYQSNMYTLIVTPPKGDKNVPRTKMSDEGTKMSRRVDKNVALTIPKELDPIELEGARDRFDDFWELYPRKVGKIAARKAWDRLTVKPEIVIDGVERMVADPNLPSLEFLPHPSTWLNEGRWEDEPYPARKPEGFVKPPAEGPGRGDWKRWYHDQGDHSFCEHD